jgi:hypothetical protein
VSPNKWQKGCTGLLGTVDENGTDVVPHVRLEVALLTQVRGRDMNGSNTHGGQVAEQPTQDDGPRVAQEDVYRGERRGFTLGLKVECQAVRAGRDDVHVPERTVYDSCPDRVTGTSPQDARDVTRAPVPGVEVCFVRLKEKKVQLDPAA